MLEMHSTKEYLIHIYLCLKPFSCYDKKDTYIWTKRAAKHELMLFLHEWKEVQSQEDSFHIF